MDQSNQNYEGYCHGDDPNWSQSFYFNVYDPKRKVGGFLRIGVLENLGEMNNWLVFFMDGKPLYTRLNMNLPCTSSRLDDGIEVAGIRVLSLELLKKTRIEFSDRHFTLNLLYEGIQPMVDCISMSSDEEGSFAREIAHVHMEGTFRVTGSITLRGGKRIEIDGHGFRDVSVGPRNWDSLLYYTTSWPIFSNGLAFAGVHGISTTGQSAYMKMFYDGKEWVRVKRFEDRNELSEDGITIKSLHWRFWDANDRMWEYTGKPLFVWPCPLDTFVANEHMMEYRLSDGTVGYGLAEASFRYDSLRPGLEAELRLANTLPYRG
ncbi:MAG: hypothetical protein RBT11_20155 [Desulfobacterales bacterium]|nr:hypothetical protein [Desulfobacterales bacterium]